MKYEDKTRLIIGCAMYVHRKLGRGYPEVIYKRALAIEMQLSGLQFEQEKQMDVIFRDQVIAWRCSDFIIDDEILLN